MRLGDVKYPMETRGKELTTKGGARGFWTEIAKTSAFHKAAKIMAIETRNNSWERIITTGSKPYVVYGLHKPFVYQKELNHSIVCNEKAYREWKDRR
jgi:hypothetical protein